MRADMLTRETRATIEAWFVGFTLYGAIGAAVLGVIGLPLWVAMLPLVPGMAMALGAFAALTLVVDRGRFAGFVAGAAVLGWIAAGGTMAGIVAGWLIALRAVAEAAAWMLRRLGWMVPD